MVVPAGGSRQGHLVQESRGDPFAHENHPRGLGWMPQRPTSCPWPVAWSGQATLPISDALTGNTVALVISAETHGEKVFLGELSIGIKQLWMNGEPTGAISAGDRALIARSGHGREPATHHPEGLPEQHKKTGCVDEWEKLGEGWGHGQGRPVDADRERNRRWRRLELPAPSLPSWGPHSGRLGQHPGPERAAGSAEGQECQQQPDGPLGMGDQVVHGIAVFLYKP